VTSLPFALPRLSAGFAALRPHARALGDRLADRAAEALAALLGIPVTIEGRALPALPGQAAGMVRLGIALEALPAEAILEVEASLAARLVDRLAGGQGLGSPALALTPVERSALELLCLVALAAVADDPEASGVAPRLGTAAGDPPNPLLLELAVTAGPIRGRCRLLLPPAALPAAGADCLVPPAAAWRVDGWVSSGGTRLGAEELASLSPGDVVLLDEPPSDAARLRLPGTCLGGRRDETCFTLEDPTVTPTAAELSLDLTVEVARVTLSLADLAALAPGGAVPLHAPADGRVILRLGDRPVARGQLVDLDGALGVRIERLEGAP